MNGAFKTGHADTDWNVSGVLRAFYYLFKDSPARRADYVDINSKDDEPQQDLDFPKKFCYVRWLENSEVTSRALKVFPFVKSYTEGVKKKPKCKSFKVAKDACADTLMLAKMRFFAFIASLMEPFLRKFQTDKPMVPFLRKNLERLIKSLLQKFVPETVIDKYDKPEKLSTLDLRNPENLLKIKNLNLDVGTEKEIRVSKASETEKVQFKKDCRNFLVALVEKLVERCPLNYKIVLLASSIDPNLISREPSCSKKKAWCPSFMIKAE